MITAKRFMVQNISPDSNDWKWGDLTVTEWKTNVWSSTPLKPLFVREWVVPGNGNTPLIAEYNNDSKTKTVGFRARKTTAYAHVVTMEEEMKPETNIYAIPAGLNENMLQGNWFDMTEALQSGTMFQMRHG